MYLELRRDDLDRSFRREIESERPALHNEPQWILMHDVQFGRFTDFHAAARDAEHSAARSFGPNRIAFEDRSVACEFLTGAQDAALKNDVADNRRLRLSQRGR